MSETKQRRPAPGKNVQGALYLNIPEINAPPPRKNKTITFRVTENLYGLLENTAEQNNITLSALIALMLEDYCNMKAGPAE